MNTLIQKRTERLKVRSLYGEVLEWNWHAFLGPTYDVLHISSDCFTLAAKMHAQDGALLKVPVAATSTGLKKLYGGVDGKWGKFYSLSHWDAEKMAQKYLDGPLSSEWDDSLRVSLYMAGAQNGGLYYFVIDFDRFDEGSPFFKQAKELADKVTRSQGGGYHMFYGINKKLATPLFRSINLLASQDAKGYVCATGKVTQDGANKVDFFCDARQLIYEWEPWDDTVPLTDKTVELYELIRDNFTLKAPGKPRLPEDPLMERMVVLGCQTGYPPNLLMHIWEEPGEQDWDDFECTTRELDW